MTTIDTRSINEQIILAVFTAGDEDKVKALDILQGKEVRLALSGPLLLSMGEAADLASRRVVLLFRTCFSPVRAAESPASLIFPELDWKNTEVSGPATLGAILGGTERFIEKETHIDDYMRYIGEAERFWPFLKQALQSAPTAEVLKAQISGCSF